MNNKYINNLLSYASIEMHMTKNKIKSIWCDDKAHFGGCAGHRMQGLASEYIPIKKENDFKVCVYCLKPENWIGEK